MSEIKRLFVHGFPGRYGGASTELHHQIIAWRYMNLEVHLIPYYDNPTREALYNEMIQRDVVVHDVNDFSVLKPCDPILGFCSAEFLEALPRITAYTRRTVFLNCMTWLFDAEKERMQQGMIAMFLYQNEAVRKAQMPQLQALNPDPAVHFLTVNPYFESGSFPYINERNPEVFGCGRISRQDADKFASNTLKIYEQFVSPRPKSGFILGFDARSEEKVGKPNNWIRTAKDQTELSQQDFYRNCDIILQPTDTTENWPRIGLEAMASGSVLIVDNRGGWKNMVDHGITGWLCDSESDFIYYASKMAYEPEVRDRMARAALERVANLSGIEASVSRWQSVWTPCRQFRTSRPLLREAANRIARTSAGNAPDEPLFPVKRPALRFGSSRKRRPTGEPAGEDASS